LIVSIKFWK
jgi:hypothetical protein